MARPKGKPNNVTATAKENIIAVFNRLSGTAGMAEWARNNLSDFYKLYARLIPQQIDMDVTVKPMDITAEPLLPDAWDERYSAKHIN
jgi:hypothetical protein